MMKEVSLKLICSCVTALAAQMLVFTACSSDMEETGNIADSPRQAIAQFCQRTEAEAIEAAVAMRQSLEGVTRGSADNEVGDVYAWRSSDIFPAKGITRGNTFAGNLPDTLLYIVNFKNNGGYTLVAANKNSGEDVVAMVDKGNLTPDDDIEGTGLQLFLERLTPRIGIPGSPLEPGIDTLELGDPVGPYPIWTTVQEVGPLLETEWNSHVSPFNDLCYTENGQHADAGSAAIAMAQICAYNQSYYPNDGYSYWEPLTDNPICPTTENARQEVAEIVADIAYGINTNFQLDYSTASFSDVMTHFYNIYYGFAEEYVNNGTTYGYEYEFYSFDDCKQSIDYEQPIFINGYSSQNNNRYSWVIDGYKITKATVFYQNLNGEWCSTYEYKKYVHCNWGGNPERNGYFLNLAFTPFGSDNGNYNDDIKVLYHLYYHGVPVGN